MMKNVPILEQNNNTNKCNTVCYCSFIFILFVFFYTFFVCHRFEGVEGVAHVIDPKAMSKETLYGVLDPNTREWTDGLFTHILR